MDVLEFHENEKFFTIGQLSDRRKNYDPAFRIVAIGDMQKLMEVYDRVSHCESFDEIEVYIRTGL